MQCDAKGTREKGVGWQSWETNGGVGKEGWGATMSLYFSKSWDEDSKKWGVNINPHQWQSLSPLDNATTICCDGLKCLLGKEMRIAQKYFMRLIIYEGQTLNTPCWFLNVHLLHSHNVFIHFFSIKSGLKNKNWQQIPYNLNWQSFNNRKCLSSHWLVTWSVFSSQNTNRSIHFC